MGRYAFFHPLDEAKAAASGFGTTKEQKFWFGIQNSVIPFATNSTAYCLREQDEEAAKAAKQSEKQCAFWKKQADVNQTSSEVNYFSEEIYDLLNGEASQEGYAELTDAHLDEYLEATWDAAEALGAPKIDVKALKSWEEFSDIWWPFEKNETEGKVRDENVKKVADLSLMQKVCVLLAKWGGFSVNFEY